MNFARGLKEKANVNNNLDMPLTNKNRIEYTIELLIGKPPSWFRNHGSSP
jgi:hypothetical protein